MDFLFENPWPLAVTLFVAAMACGLAGRATARGSFLIAMGGLLAAMPVPFLLDAWKDTPTEQVAARLDELFDAVRRSDPAPIVRCVSSRYQDGKHDRDAIVRLIEREIGRLDITSLVVSGVTIEPDETGEAIETRFLTKLTGSYQTHSGEGHPMRWRMRFEAEDPIESTEENWRFVLVERLPILGPPRPIPLTSP